MIENAALKTYGIFASQSNAKIINRLQSEECNLILFPESAINAAQLNKSETLIVKEISKFDWLVFFEPDGVECFLAALNALEIDLFELDNLRICALGELTADRLRFEQIHTDIIFTVQQKKIGELIGEYVGNESEPESRKILIVRESGVNLEIERELAESPMLCTTLEIFESALSEDTNPAKLKALLKGGAVDEMILTSARDLISLKKLYRLTEYDQKSDFQILASTENLVQYLLENGLPAKLFR